MVIDAEVFQTIQVEECYWEMEEELGQPCIVIVLIKVRIAAAPGACACGGAGVPYAHRGASPPPSPIRAPVNPPPPVH